MQKNSVKLVSSNNRMRTAYYIRYVYVTPFPFLFFFLKKNDTFPTMHTLASDQADPGSAYVWHDITYT